MVPIVESHDYEKLSMFFHANGLEDAPDMSDCLHCPQFGNGCEPRIMRKEFFAEVFERI